MLLVQTNLQISVYAGTEWWKCTLIDNLYKDPLEITTDPHVMGTYTKYHHQFGHHFLGQHVYSSKNY